MSGLWMILIAAGIMLASGVPAAAGARTSRPRQFMAVALLLLGSVTGWAGLVIALAAPASCEMSFPWNLPWGRFSVGVDPLSAVFLVPIFTIPALGAVYGLDYWRQDEHPENGRSLSLFYGLLAGAMVMVVIARDSVLLLVFWEIMALSAFFLAAAEDEIEEVRRAGWIYLVATHAGTVCLLALFALLRQGIGDFSITALDASSLPSGTTVALFALAIAGFGFKAGIMPLHVWLPGAHANAPSHVSAVMSGVMLKMGIYGILRILTLLPVPDLWNGEVLLGIGAITGVLGIAFAIGQRDIKRLLAYSSIENIGIIMMGIGLALTGRTLQRPEWVLLGLGGALLHVWNHALFKSLLFLNAGTIMHAVQTRDMNRMGGLAKPMPRTAALFLLGAVAICGLPPLNGFVSEWLIYLGLLQNVTAANGMSGTIAGIGVAALAMIGALALACFVKVFSMVFLGLPRHAEPSRPHDPPARMRRPMLVLAAGCLALGILPQAGMRLIWRATAQWIDTTATVTVPPTAALAPVSRIGLLAALLIVAAGSVVLLLRKHIRRHPPDPIGTWGCGYALPTPRMQYTADSFAEMLVKLFAWVLRPGIRRPRIQSPFPPKSGFSIHIPDTLLERLALPLFRRTGQQMMKLRLIQQGRISIYLLYILVMTLVLLSWLWVTFK